MTDQKVYQLNELGRYNKGLLVKPAGSVSLTVVKNNVGRPLSYFVFYHCDGMYSFCKTVDGDVIHLRNDLKVTIAENSAIGEKN
jgi:hypothetical protein